MKKLIVFLLTFFVAAAQGACTIEFFNDSNDLLWIVPENVGDRVGLNDFPHDKYPNEKFRIGPNERQRFVFQQNAPQFVYIQEYKQGGTPATGGRVGGWYPIFTLVRTYEITVNEIMVSKTPVRKKCPTMLVKASNFNKNRITGITVKKVN